MIKRILVAMALLLPLPASAQIDLGYHQIFDTRFGQMQVVGGDETQQLWFEGEFLPLPTQSRYWIHGAYGLADEAFDWVLVSHHHGGNSCGGAYHIIRASTDGLQISPEIGVCALPVLDVRVVRGMIEIDLIHMNVAIDRETFAFDGTTLTSVEDRQIAQSAAGLGADITRWIDTHPNELFQDPTERARFGAIMTDADIENLATHVSVATGTFVRDGWVVGQGCFPHNCGNARGIWGIRMSDGLIAAAIMTAGGPFNVYGAADMPAFAAVMREHAP